MASGTGSRRGALVAVGAALSMVALTACGVGGAGGSSDDDGDVTLTFQWWGNDDRAAATEKVVDLYEKKHPGVTIETSFAPDTSYWEKMATQVAGGNTPDIFQMKLEYFKEYQQRGVIADLTPYTEGDDPALRTDTTAPMALAAGKIDDKVYGMPTGSSTQAFFYDAAAWKKLGLDAPADGWTWDDLVAAGEKVQKETGGKQAVMADFGNEQAWFESWLLQRGKSVYTDDGALNFTEADLEEFWNFTSGLAKDGVLTPASVTTANDRTTANSPLVKGKALGELNDVSLASAYFDAFGEVAMAPIPADEGAKTTGQYAGVTQLLTVAKTSEHAEEAAKFVDFFLNDPEAGKILGITRGMPANQNVLSDIATGFEAGDKATYDFEQKMAPTVIAKPPVAPEGGSQSLTDFKSEYDQVIFGKLSVKDAAADMFQKFQDNIS
ncbi:sugar ABC transporter substrate-binding protein [Isoptericola sp. F-RaC21]|uniref:ABC transporter substrate-binding protein n=1 Tax=Isoptericola sp. F-RaC21 TaxID=3141452 RepID=UPI00315B57B3